MGDAEKYDLPLKPHLKKKKKKKKNFTLYDFYFSNVNVFIISYYDSNSIEKLLWKNGFSYFCRNWNDAKQNRSLATILKRYFGGVFVSWKWLVYRHIKYSIITKFYDYDGKVVLGVPWRPPVHQRVGKTLVTWVEFVRNLKFAGMYVVTL